MVPMSSWRRRWSLLMLLGLLALSPAVDATNGAGGVTYYGVENDPERSTSGNDSAAAVRAATGAGSTTGSRGPTIDSRASRSWC